MGKTVHHKFTANDVNSTVSLKIRGPKCILGRRQPFEVTANVNATWLSVLNNKCNLTVSKDDGFFLCAAECRHDPAGYKWRTELTDKVRDYVNRYSKKMRVYTISIRHHNARLFGIRKYPKKSRQNKQVNQVQSESNAGINIQQPTVLMPPPPVPSTSRGVIVPTLNSRSAFEPIPTPEGSEASWATPRIQHVTSFSQEDNLVRRDYPGSDDDQISSITTASQESEELRSQGIVIENLKSFATKQFMKCPNNMLLRMKNEIRIQNENGNWMRVQNRNPICAHFLQDILGFLKDPK